MHTKNDNEEIMNGSDTDEIIKGLFESFLQKYEENLQERMKGSDFEFDGVDFLYYDFNKVSFIKLIVILKEYLKLNLLLSNIIGKKSIFHLLVKIGKNSN